jgi:hypothetical protein
MPAFIAIAAITGVSALLFLWLWLSGKFADKMDAIRRVDPKRARRITTILIVIIAGLWIINDLWEWLETSSPTSSTGRSAGTAAR